jgi:hypothetical protein
MNNTRKELFELIAEQGVYLPNYQLDKAEEMLKSLTKTEGYFKAIQLVEECWVNTEYKEPAKGAYMTQDRHRQALQNVKKRIVGVDKEGNTVEFDSIYAAAMSLKGNKSCAGNISDALKGRKKTAYSYKWTEV